MNETRYKYQQVTSQYYSKFKSYGEDMKSIGISVLINI